MFREREILEFWCKNTHKKKKHPAPMTPRPPVRYCPPMCVRHFPSDMPSVVVSLWHRSGPNQTERARRVFYAQYSVDVIRATPSDPRPLSLAVPCLLSRPARIEHAERRRGLSRLDPPSLEISAVAGAAAVETGRRLGTEGRNPDDSVDSATLGMVVRKRAEEAGRDCSRVSCRGSKRGR